MLNVLPAELPRYVYTVLSDAVVYVHKKFILLHASLRPKQVQFPDFP